MVDTASAVAASTATDGPLAPNAATDVTDANADADAKANATATADVTKNTNNTTKPNASANVNTVVSGDAHSAATEGVDRAQKNNLTTDDDSRAARTLSRSSFAAAALSVRRQNLANRIADIQPTDTVYTNAPLPPPANGARLVCINNVARHVQSLWTRPSESQQYDSPTLHQIRAILYMRKTYVTQSFISSVSNVSQASLSHYVRGIFKGNQSTVDERLAIFVKDFADGKHDPALEEIRKASRLPTPTGATPERPHTAPVASSYPTGPLISVNLANELPTPPPAPPKFQPVPWDSRNLQTPTVPRPAPQTMESSTQSSGKAQTPAVRQAVVTHQMQKSQSNQPPTQTQPQSGPEKAQQASDRARRAAKRRTSDAGRPRTAISRPAFPPVPDEAEDRPLTPVLAVERAYHALVAPVWSDEHPDTEPLLLPIELYVECGKQLLHMYTQWDVNERHLSPEVVAERIRRARGLPIDFAEPAAKQIRHALFRAGVVCPAPPHAKEDRRLLCIAVELAEPNLVHQLRDECEWDISMPALNSPEVFSQHLCVDAGVSQRHAPAVARALREQLSLAQALAYGDDATKKEARAKLGDGDPLLDPLPPVENALTKAAAAERRVKEREEHEKIVWSGVVEKIFEEVEVEAERRRTKRLQEEERRRVKREMEEARRREEEAKRKRREMEEEAEREAEREAEQIYTERNLDFRPYLALKVARDERACLWLPPAFDRRRRKQLTFPMTQQSRKSGSGRSGANNSRASKRRRTSRREEVGTAERRTSSASVESGMVGSKRGRGGFDMELEDSEEKAERRQIMLKLRVRAVGTPGSGRKSSERKRRR